MQSDATGREIGKMPFDLFEQCKRPRPVNEERDEYAD
jgi:hypothetical protein